MAYGCLSTSNALPIRFSESKQGSLTEALTARSAAHRCLRVQVDTHRLTIPQQRPHLIRESCSEQYEVWAD
jgi:hypothetical protein